MAQAEPGRAVILSFNDETGQAQYNGFLFSSSQVYFRDINKIIKIRDL